EALHLRRLRNALVYRSAAATGFATDVKRERERHAMHQLVGVLVVLPLHAIVFVQAGAVRVECIFTKTVGIPDEVQIAGWPPEDLPAKSRATVEFAVRLPAVDEPGFKLQLVRREPLGAETGEKPRRVRRNVRGLIAPVVEAVVTVQTDERHEDTGLEIQTVLHVHVVTGITFREVPVGVGEIPLAVCAGVAGVVTWNGCSSGAELGQHSHLQMVPMEVAADVQLLEDDFTGSLTFGSAGERVIDRVIQ